MKNTAARGGKNKKVGGARRYEILSGSDTFNLVTLGASLNCPEFQCPHL